MSHEKKVLIGEDDIGWIKLIKEQVLNCSPDTRIFESTTIVEAVTISDTANNKFDIAILDFGLGDVNQSHIIQFAQKLQQRGCIIFFLTGQNSSEFEELKKTYGFLTFNKNNYLNTSDVIDEFWKELETMLLSSSD
jgi:hypothetical protein